MKSQEHQPIMPLYPIPNSEMDADFSMLSDLDDDDLTFLRDDYLHHLADTDPTHFLMTLDARRYLSDVPLLRRTYRAGVIAGSVILRERLHAIGQDPHEVFDGEFQREVDWPTMKLARFTLGQYFAADVDIKQHLYQTVEFPWFLHNSHYAPYGELQSANDWMAVGMGDILRIGDVAETHFTGQKLRHPLISPLEHESLLTDEL
jgi:hypothetical protein